MERPQHRAKIESMVDFDSMLRFKSESNSKSSGKNCPREK